MSLASLGTFLRIFVIDRPDPLETACEPWSIDIAAFVKPRKQGRTPAANCAPLDESRCCKERRSCGHAPAGTQLIYLNKSEF